MSSSADRLSAALAGRYRIERELGAGGMATVYVAEDLKHDRKVAIKVLKPELAAVLGAERFVVEIKTTAAMSHPHILPLFDSGTADGFLFYVMPYIQGETIREKLNRETQFGVDEAVRIAREVADALDYAHRHGVIHRDIKPENILLHDGRAMVMDFGIALAVSAAAGGRMTETGLSLGTPHYMSPEQATAEKEITARSDQYSLASVLYEMLAGEPPHTGGTAQQVIMKIIAEPLQPVRELRKNVTSNVDAALAKALEKLPADRFESAAKFAEALANPGFAGAGATGWAGSIGAPRALMRAFVSAIAIATIAIAVAVWALVRPSQSADSPVVRLPLDMPPRAQLYTVATGSNVIAISPQGDQVAYVAQDSAGVATYVRKTSEVTPRKVAAELGNNLSFSPNGRWLAFVAGNELRKAPTDGGPAVLLANTSSLVERGLAWLGPDTLLIGSLTGLKIMSAAGGTIRTMPGSDSTVQSVWPIVLADGKTLAFTVGTAGARRLALLKRGDAGITELDIPAAVAIGYRDRHLLFVNLSGDLMAVPFDLDRRRPTGDPVQVESNIRVTNPGAANAVLSESGSLLYGTGDPNSRLMIADANGVFSPLLPEVRNYRYPRFSPDGRKVAVNVTNPPASDIWVYDRVDRTFQRLTTSGNTSAPEWSPDGKRLLFRVLDSRGRQPVVSLPADGSGTADTLYSGEPVNEAMISPDGNWLLYRTGPGSKYSRDIFARPLTGDTASILLAGGPTQESHPRLSPDGKWLAYQSNESGGGHQVYVRPFPNAGSRIQVSTAGGTEPIWARSGRELYYRTLDGFAAVEVTTGAGFSLGRRRVTAQSMGTVDDNTHQNYDLTADGKLLVVVSAGGGSSAFLVHNWGRELREKLGFEKKP